VLPCMVVAVCARGSVRNVFHRVLRLGARYGVGVLHPSLHFYFLIMSTDELRCNNLECRVSLSSKGQAVVTTCSREPFRRSRLPFLYSDNPAPASSPLMSITDDTQTSSAVSELARRRGRELKMQCRAPTTFLHKAPLARLASKISSSRKRPLCPIASD
jgi:hypothetical protein